MKIVLLLLLCATSLFGEKVIVMLGAPASGKGTHAKRISKELHLPHISTGDLLRENVKGETALGKEAKGYMDEGKLVPDALVQQMLFERIQKPDASEGYILDGFPRTIAQAEALEAYTKNAQVVAIDIEVPKEELLKRVAVRQKAEGRADDTQEVAKKRLEVYAEQTAPLIEYYKAKGQLHVIDGNRTVESVYKEIMGQL